MAKFKKIPTQKRLFDKIATLGTVTSVGLSLPAIFAVSGSPVTGSGNLTATLANQTANNIFAGPVSGGASAPAFRALVAGDIPALDAAKITTGVFSPARIISGGGTDNHVFFQTGGVFSQSANLQFDGNKVIRLKPTSGSFTEYKDGGTLLSAIADDGSFRTTNDINTGKYGLYGTSRLGIAGATEIRLMSPEFSLFGNSAGIPGDITIKTGSSGNVTWTMGGFDFAFTNIYGDFEFLKNFAGESTAGLRYAQTSAGGEGGTRYLVDFQLTAGSSHASNQNISVYANVIDNRSIAGECIGLRANANSGTNTSSTRIGILVDDHDDFAIKTGLGKVYFGDDLEIADGANLIFGTSTGTKIGQSGAKLAFYGATPVTQPSAPNSIIDGISGTVLSTMTSVDDGGGNVDLTLTDDNFKTLLTLVLQLRSGLRAQGIFA